MKRKTRQDKAEYNSIYIAACKRLLFVGQGYSPYSDTSLVIIMTQQVCLHGLILNIVLCSLRTFSCSWDSIDVLRKRRIYILNNEKKNAWLKPWSDFQTNIVSNFVTYMPNIISWPLSPLIPIRDLIEHLYCFESEAKNIRGGHIDRTHLCGFA